METTTKSVQTRRVEAQPIVGQRSKVTQVFGTLTRSTLGLTDQTRHHGEQSELVDALAERVQILGVVSVAMGSDAAALTKIESPEPGREEVPVQICDWSMRTSTS